MTRTIFAYVTTRSRVLAAVAVLLVLATWDRDEPAEDLTAEAVASWLGARLGGEVEAQDFVWEERASTLWDRLVGRGVVFIGTVNGQTDVYRAQVRLSREGRPLSLWQLHNLTDTPLGKEMSLVARGERFAFVTADDTGTRSVTLIEVPRPRPFSWAGLGLTWRAAQARRWEIAFTEPPDQALVEIAEDGLILSLGEDRIAAAFLASTGQLDVERGNPFGARAQELPSRDVADSTRASLLSAWRGLSAPFAGDVAIEAEPAHGAPASAGWAEGLWVAADDAGPWFPPGDGWTPMPEDAALALRDVPGEGGTTLVAVDTRRLELRYAPGRRHPDPDIGPHGTGAVRDPERVRAMFWGPPPGTRGAAVAEGLPLTRVQAGGLALGALAGGAPWIGVAHEEPGEELELPFMRQVVLSGDDGKGPRAGVCITQSGQLVYGFSAEAAWSDLATALRDVQCGAAISFGRGEPVAFARVESSDGALRLSAVDESMLMPDVVDLTGSDYELFYLVDTALAPKRDPDAWTAVTIADSSASIDGLFRRRVERLGAEVDLYVFQSGYFDWSIRAGSKERDNRTGHELVRGLLPFEAESLVFAVNMGNGRKKSTRGLVTNGAEGIRIRKGEGALVVQGPSMRVLPSSRIPDWIGGDATELPLTADDGELVEDARVLGARRLRSAICIGESGEVFVALSVFDSHEANTTALLDMGCRRVVALDRGTHDDATHWLRGMAEIPTEPESTHLYVRARSPRPRGRISPTP